MPALSILFRLNDPKADPASQYEEGFRLIEGAESIGIDAAWITSHHFGSDKGSIAAPLLYLAAASQRTKRIRLGAGVVVLPLEDPVRTAEDAAITQLLSANRLELGLGSGLEDWSFATFGVDWNARHEVFDEKLAVLKSALSGAELKGGRRLHPPGNHLLRHIWRIVVDPKDAERVAREGDNMILGASKKMTLQENRDRQFRSITVFRAHARPDQKIALSRGIFVGANGDDARARYEAAIPDAVKAKRDSGDQAYSAEDAAIVGDPAEARARVLADPLFDLVDEVLAQIIPAKLPVKDWLPSLRLLRTHVFPVRENAQPVRLPLAAAE